ncbi:hypothetical protein E2C01_022340 [Portunus trituberculatus]|uniref:Uncharacterized protein n=1 Tax=Portunus trituberculatus TaxID=210409 RepID=A0A5B7E533_PORTR|nr:hypothetical protein [Portunus trituberculatus]
MYDHRFVLKSLHLQVNEEPLIKAAEPHMEHRRVLAAIARRSGMDATKATAHLTPGLAAPHRRNDQWVTPAKHLPSPLGPGQGSLRRAAVQARPLLAPQGVWS